LISLKDAIVEKIQGALGYLELFPEDAKVVFLGLDNAGKTTLLKVLEREKVGVHQPTGTPQHGEFKHNGLLFDSMENCKERYSTCMMFQ